MDETHLLFLKQIHAQIKSNHAVYVQSAQWYDRLSFCMSIPCILITSSGSIIAFVSASSFVSTETQSIMAIWLGALGILSTLVQSCHTTLKFGTKAEMFRNAAEQYNQLLIKIQFEQIHHNEKSFIGVCSRFSPHASTTHRCDVHFPTTLRYKEAHNSELLLVFC